MSQWMLWYLLSAITGSPVASLVALAIVWWLGDRWTFRVLPQPIAPLRRWSRAARLRKTLAVNPHDRRARFDLAQLLLEMGRPRDAAATLRPNLEAGDDDLHTTFVYGVALARSGAPDAAERVLALARAADPQFRLGEIDLELGILRLARGDAAGARAALEQVVAARPGTVAGRYHLARALALGGDEEGARRVRRDAWREYAALPRFRQREERRFAWRIQPWRPALLVAAIAACALLAGRCAAVTATPTERRALHGESSE